MCIDIVPFHVPETGNTARKKIRRDCLRGSLFAMICNEFRQFRLAVSLHIMAAAERFICILATNGNLGTRCTGFTESKDGLCTIAAVGAESLELADIICKGDEIQELTEGAALRVAVQANADHVFSTPLYSGEGEVTKVRKELGLLNNNTLCRVETVHANHGHKSGDGDGGIRLFVMTDDPRLCAITCIKCGCETESLTTNDFITAHDAEDGGGLACKHGAEIEIQRHSSGWCVFMGG
jgi:hypothetical protein